MTFVSQNKFHNEQDIAKFLISESYFLENPDISQNAELLIQFCRKNKKQQTKLDAFMAEYGLSNSEGIALMCLAESLMRIPDDQTRNSLINEKLTSASWSKHLGRAESFLVNSATWGLQFSKKFLQASSYENSHWLTLLGKKIGETSIREAVQIAMQILSKEFVCAQDIQELQNSSWLKIHRCSFDMLGEASRNQSQSDNYLEAYLEAISSISQINQTQNLTNGISIKLSALYSKYDALHHREVKKFLLPRVKDLILEASNKDVAVTIDAEEQDRLALSLELFQDLALDPSLKSWPKLGLAVQAYGKRSLEVIEYLNDLTEHRERMHVRLVKGAYWDYEIKNAQVKGLSGYPVFTNKQLTDLNYLVTAKKLIASPNIDASFATHNAHSIAAIMSLGLDETNEIEFQRLYGMGELLYLACQDIYTNFYNTSVYCPIGKHKELLPYLVRRLLENGANSSFINQYLDPGVPESKLSVNPAKSIIEKIDHMNISNLPLPSELYLPRQNSKGTDLSEVESIQNIMGKISESSEPTLEASVISQFDIEALNSVNAISKCNQSIIGKSHFSNPDSITNFMIKPSLDWARSSIDSRTKLLNDVADAIEAQKSQFLYLLIHEAGKTLQDANDELREAVDFMRYYADQATTLHSKVTQRGTTGEDNILEYYPKGLVVCISPWNFPLAITMGQIAAALVTGNTVLAKPSEHTSLIGYMAVSLFFDHGLPLDALHFLPGDGKLGQAIISSQHIDLVVFTGSFKTAKKIQQTLSNKPGKIVPLIAETSGLNSMVVDSSALVERACDDSIRSAFNSAGQRCSALRLLLVHEEIYGEVIPMLKGMMDELIIGSPDDPSVDIGPIISTDSVQNLNNYLKKDDPARENIYQVELSKNLKDNWFAPTLIEMSSIDNIAEEQFGPILHVIPFADDNLDAFLTKVDGKGFALTFGIHTRIDSRALHAAKLVSAGNTYINRDIVGAVVETQPFGGKNLSGSGLKAGGPHYLIQFIDEKTTSINTVAIGGNTELLNQLPD
jgi:RHH-type proline utilization regulon transcriptional repressor/proline dehydrogenase/delta 1-pyrroline-5-carboxylate dehydrogenase